MRKWMGAALALVLAATGATLAALPQQAGSEKDRQRKRETTVERTRENPAREVRRLAVLGERGVRIGVSVKDADASSATPGAVVDEVRDQSPAAKAGVKPGDVFVEFDGERIRSARQLSRVVGETALGRAVKAGVMREGRRVDLQITPEAGGEPMAFSWSGDGPMAGFHAAPEFRLDMKDFEIDKDAFRDLAEGARRFHVEPGEPRRFDFFIGPGSRARLGVTLEGLTPQLGEYFGAERGALVSSVAPDSPAAKAGLRAGDVITAVGDKAVDSPADVAEAVRKADDGSELTVTYTRDKKPSTAKVTLEPTKKREKPGQPV